MTLGKRAARAAREEKKAREKRTRRLQRDERRSRVRMTVVNASSDNRNPLSLVHELHQCNSALLYGDEVKLVSPRAAMLKSAQQVNESDGVELLRVFRNVAPKYFPDAQSQLDSLFDVIDSLPPRLQLPPQLRQQYDDHVRKLVEGMQPLKDGLKENFEKLLIDSGYGQLQEAVDAGILTVDDVDGAVVSELRDQDNGTTMLAYLRKIDNILTDGGRYPLFDSDTSNLVRLGVDIGYFSPVPMARRLGSDAAMANGLFDRLPTFEYATTREILDIRTELSGSLSAFRQGVRGLTEGIVLAPEDPDFVHEIVDAWNQKVSPALDELEATIAENRSMRDLMRRTVKDPIGGAALGGAATLPATMAIAAGPISAYVAAAAVAVGCGIATARALIDESRDVHDAKKAQFYFLFGADQRLKGVDRNS